MKELRDVRIYMLRTKRRSRSRYHLFSNRIIAQLLKDSTKKFKSERAAKLHRIRYQAMKDFFSVLTRRSIHKNVYGDNHAK